MIHFWKIYILGFGIFYAVVVAVIAYFFFFRKIGKEERCSCHILGEVIGLSHIRYGDIAIPLVKYEVDHRIYKISGPKFRGGRKLHTSSLKHSPETEVETNLTTREDLPDKIYIKTKGNFFITRYTSPLMELYPVGSKVDVYYNPNKPKEAFVQRCLEPNLKWGYILLVISAIILISSIVFATHLSFPFH